MPIGTVRAGSVASTAAATSIAVPYPASVVAGEVLILCWSSVNVAGVTAPGSWVKPSGGEVAEGILKLSVMYLESAVGSETGSLTVTQTNFSSTAQMFAVQDVSNSNPLDVSTASNAHTAGTTTNELFIPAVTAVTAGALPFYVVSSNNTLATFSGPPGSDEFTEWSAGGGNARSGAAYRDTVPLTAAGSTGTRRVVPSSSARMAAVMLLLRPAASTGTTSTGTLPASVALTGTAKAVRGTTGTLPASAGLTSAAGAVRATTATLPAAAALTGTTRPVIAATGTLPAAAALTGVTRVGGTTTGSLPAIVGLTGTTQAGRTGTGALPVTVNLRGVGVVGRSVATGRVEVNAALTGTVAVQGRAATGTFPLTVGVVAARPLARTEVRFTLLDGEGAPRPRVHARARLIPPAYLITDQELEAPYETYSSPAGLVSLFLPPVSLVAPGAFYEVTYAGRTRRVAVPDRGPVDLSGLLLGPSPVPGPGPSPVPGPGPSPVPDPVPDPGPDPGPDPSSPVPGFGSDDGTFAAPGAAGMDDGTFALAGPAFADDGLLTGSDGGTSSDGETFTAGVRADVASDADWILGAQLTDGGLAQYPDKTYMVPYFSNLAALGLARATQVTGDLKYTDACWRWLDWYVAHMDANGYVTDYTIAPNQAVASTGDMDSTDSYAATFLMAAHKTWTVTGNTTRLATLSAGLTKAVDAIKSTQTSDGLTWAKPSYHVKYLMDNAEAWAGLQAAYAMAGALGNTTLQESALTASRAIETGLETMWNTTNQTYNWAKFENGAQSASSWSVGYPDAHAQAFAVAFGLVRGTRATDLVNKFNIEQPLWDQPAATHNGVLVSYWPPSGWAFIRVGQTTRSQAGAASIRAAAIAANRAWPHHTGVAGGLITLESTDPSYLAPLTPSLGDGLDGGTFTTAGSSADGGSFAVAGTDSYDGGAF